MSNRRNGPHRQKTHGNVEFKASVRGERRGVVEGERRPCLRGDRDTARALREVRRGVRDGAAPAPVLPLACERAVLVDQDIVRPYNRGRDEREEEGKNAHIDNRPCVGASRFKPADG